jgi:hypothetical protein
MTYAAVSTMSDKDGLSLFHARTFAFLTDQVFRRRAQIIEEDFGRGVVHHRADRPDRETLSKRFAHVDDQHRKPIRAFHAVRDRLPTSSQLPKRQR